MVSHDVKPSEATPINDVKFEVMCSYNSSKIPKQKAAPNGAIN